MQIIEIYEFEIRNYRERNEEHELSRLKLTIILLSKVQIQNT